MVVEDQGAVIALLSDPATHGGEPVERIETHASVIFLAGSRAWKLKRAVKYDFLDFSGVERRRAMCEAELRLNRRTAPELYQRVVPVVRRADGTLALGGAGDAVDWVIEMVRFDQDLLLDRLAERGALDPALMPPLAEAIAALHRDAERRPDQGGAAGMAWVVDGNEADLTAAAGALDPDLLRDVIDRTRAALERGRGLLESRRRAGFVRHCHGDLHLGNIVLWQGRPVPFDGVEFNDAVSCVDVLYDLAFLLMDLWRRRLPAHASDVFNRYLATTGVTGGLSLLPLFLSCRAAVRSKISLANAALEGDARRRGNLEDQARQYLNLAHTFLRPPRATIVAVGGVSGTGKSTLARRLAPSLGAAPGAVVLRSDVIRKRLCGVPESARLGPEGYTSDVTARVYAHLVDEAAAIAASGHSVIADAVFGRDEDKRAIEGAAARVGVPFTGIWLEAPEKVLVDRVDRRRGDASDADADVVRRQLTSRPSPGTWLVVDASRAPDAVLDDVRAQLSSSVSSS
ncbi:MAG TPA: AAA family ATPase [Vicinamibacterales bacterium]